MPKPVANGTHTPHASGLNEICSKLANIIKILIDKHVYKFCNVPLFKVTLTQQTLDFGLTHIICIQHYRYSEAHMSIINHFTLNYPQVEAYI